MADNQPPCLYLVWDSEFFGFRIARANVNRLDQDTIESIFAWCSLHRIDCLYFLSDSNDITTVRLAEDHEFRCVDIRLTLEKRLDTAPAPGARTNGITFHLHTPDDVAFLCAIARTNYRSTRFYYDRNFPRSLCDALYETWIRKSCNGYADAVLVAEVEKQPSGFISCHLLDSGQGQIGLAGVSPHMQGHGLGPQLLHESLQWFADRDVRQVTVITQGRNIEAQRLYQRSGFLTQSVRIWYHKWFAKESEGVR